MLDLAIQRRLQHNRKMTTTPIICRPYFLLNTAEIRTP